MSGWICPDCGEPNSGELCTKCHRNRPIQLSTYNSPGSYGDFVYGPNGYQGCPTWFARMFVYCFLAVLVGMGVLQLVWALRR